MLWTCVTSGSQRRYHRSVSPTDQNQLVAVNQCGHTQTPQSPGAVPEHTKRTRKGTFLFLKIYGYPEI
uniref:Uncharacterized protein n=1 Tax=Anopheles minimus TaxID=112268 RepID=A0A182WBX6_9DIPT